MKGPAPIGLWVALSVLAGLAFFLAPALGWQSASFELAGGAGEVRLRRHQDFGMQRRWERELAVRFSDGREVEVTLKDNPFPFSVTSVYLRGYAVSRKPLLEFRELHGSLYLDLDGMVEVSPDEDALLPQESYLGRFQESPAGLEFLSPEESGEWIFENPVEI